MKKQGLRLWLTLTLVFAAFTAGFFLGRNYRPAAVQLSVPAAMLTEPALPSATETLAVEGTTADETEPPITFPIDLNTAQERELMALPGIGETFAARILAYRQEIGAFQTVEELLNVKGIGEKRLEAILDYITIGG